jgi:MarR family transcriptional regulator, transcriptional regulator for hemolysin
MAGDPAQRTQLEIATQLGIDKSTLVPILDRLERDGLIVRTFSERDRRVRIPRATQAGLAVASQVATARDAAINDRLTARSAGTVSGRGGPGPAGAARRRR